MKKRYIKGFTLVELLAVIIIIGLAALIITPQIIKVLNNSQKDSFMDSATGLLESAELYNSEHAGEKTVLDLSIESELRTLKFKGTPPTGGTLIINENGETSLHMYNKKWCAIKKFTSQKVQMYKVSDSNCSSEISTNLLENGALEENSNKNFTSFKYNENNGEKYLTYTGNSSTYITGNQYVPIDSTKRYRVTFEAKANNTNSRYYAGIMEHDEEKKQILPTNVMYVENTLTSLRSDLKNGDTKVYLKSLKNWNTTSDRGFIFWNYKDINGKTYSPLTYSKNTYANLYNDSNSVDKVNNTITLSSAWNNGTIPAGTKLSQSSSGAVFNYSILENSALTTDWKVYMSSIITGINKTGSVSSSQFRAGTKFIRFSIIFNKNSVADTTLYLRNIKIEEV